ncbi:hypothetical protein [Aneurinibacillus tyrosinisolvens]|uniref:hypothetical protein n=1 Tax=Aneurinibacillus tyrosinisolvens TaxID=1443435 RepID=UPI00063F8E1D|nr:hypothetical protein [Aneurinibacillus tyrosinisolvens]
MNVVYGRLLYFNKHSIIPQQKNHEQFMWPGEIITYTISEKELAKYRNLPPVTGKKPFSLPHRKK